MKNIYLALLTAFILPLSIAAENTGSHCLAVWGEGGIANYIGKTPGAKATIGGGGGLGLGYEYRGQKFLLQTGVGALYTNTGLKINDNATTYTNQLIDDEGWVINKYTYYESKRRDDCSQVAMQVPLLFGAHFNYFYFLMGAKLNVNLYNQTKVKGTYRTTGYYEQFIDEFEDMDNHHFFSTGEVSTTSKNSMKINVAASLELGAEFNIVQTRGKGNQYLRVAAFADFNILDDCKKSYKPLTDYPQTWAGISKLQDIKQTNYLYSSSATNPLRQLVAGIKVTWLISSKVKYNCVICEGGYPSERDRRRGSRIMIN